jgi:DNA-binding transcriptional LysR family regulator
MNFKTLRYVVTIAKEQSFSKAAKALFVSQPTLTQAIQDTEKKLGTQLFDRKKYPLSPTYAGKIFIEFAQQVLLSEALVNQKMVAIASEPREYLRIGISPHRSSFMMPDVVCDMMSKFPNCSIYIEDSTNETQLYKMLEAHNIDIMIGNPIQNNAKFTTQFIAREYLILAVPKEYNIKGLSISKNNSKFPAINLLQLKERPFIMMPTHTYLGESLRTLCDKEEFVPIHTIECSNVLTCFSMAEKGLGVALVPEFVTRFVHNSNRLDFFMSMHAAPWNDICIITNSGEAMTEPANYFIEIFRERYSSY